MLDEVDDCCENQGFLYAFHVEVNCGCECHDWVEIDGDDE